MKKLRTSIENTRILTFLGLFFCFLVIYLLFPSKVRAAYFFLDPRTKTVTPGTTFDVRLMIDTEGAQTTSAEATLLFNQDLLGVWAVVGGGFYPYQYEKIYPGKVKVGGVVESAIQPKAGQGEMAVITFEGKNNGTAAVQFDCAPGKTSDSNITQEGSGAPDILDCAKLQNGTYIIAGQNGNPTATPQPTSQPTASPTPRPTFGPTCTPVTVQPSLTSPPAAQPSPTGLPVTGIATPSILLLGISALLTIAGVLFIL